MDWSTVFEYRNPRPGATHRQLADFAIQVRRPPTDQEIAEVAARQRNPWRPGDPLHAPYRPIDANRWRMPDRPLSPDYLALLAWSNGGDFRTGDREFQLSPTDGPDGVRATMLAYELPEYMPGAVPFAFNGGGVFYLFDMRQPGDGECPVVAAHAGSLGWATHQQCWPPNCWPVADSLQQACRGRTNIEDLADCDCHAPAARFIAGLPSTADIYVDRVPPDSIPIAVRLRRLLGVTWRMGELRGLLASQPILAVKAGRPVALRHALDQHSDLQPYLFYGVDGGLEPVWSGHQPH